MSDPASDLAGGLAAALVLTIVVEAAVGWLRGYRNPQAVSVIVLVNLVTNPAVNLLMWLNAVQGAVPSWAAFPGLEAAVIVIEAGLLSFALGFSLRRTSIDSVCLNLASAGGGVLLYLALRR